MISKVMTVFFLWGILALFIAEGLVRAADFKRQRHESALARHDSRAGRQSALRLQELKRLEDAVQSLGGTVEHARILHSAGREFDIDPFLLASVAYVESSFRPKVSSKKGARGLMQLRPVVTNVLGVTNPWDPHENIMAGAAYLRTCFERYADHANSTYLALAAYNIGPGPVRKLAKSDAAERFVNKILGVYNTLTDIPIRVVKWDLNRTGGLKTPAFAEILDIE